MATLSSKPCCIGHLAYPMFQCLMNEVLGKVNQGHPHPLPFLRNMITHARRVLAQLLKNQPFVKGGGGGVSSMLPQYHFSATSNKRECVCSHGPG